MKDFSQIWLTALDETMARGLTVAPRGRLTKELPQRTLEVNMQQPVLRVEKRQLSYQFMAAEAYWILTGDDRVATISPYNSRIAEFSDDGERFFGAYGPKILAQLPYVIDKLNADRMSRQAGLTIWRENPPTTKDVPCTVAIFASIRDEKLNMHVFMRSSDLWLGVPYDVFNFAMLGHYICALLNKTRLTADFVQPGILYLTAASSHLYQDNWEAAFNCLTDQDPLPQADTPKFLWRDEDSCLEWLRDLRDTKPGHILRWWERQNAS
jgi:thymidylate synthase